MPNSDSEFGNWVIVTHSGGQTRHPTLAFDAHPCDAGLRQRVEGVTFEGRATSREDDDDGLVRHARTLGVRA